MGLKAIMSDKKYKGATLVLAIDSMTLLVKGSDGHTGDESFECEVFSFGLGVSVSRASRARVRGCNPHK